MQITTNVTINDIDKLIVSLQNTHHQKMIAIFQPYLG